MRVPEAVVCLPTYNERENLEAMLLALGDKGVRVLVIDDSSPDGTGEIADRLERIVPDSLWPLPKYAEILFIK